MVKPPRLLSVSLVLLLTAGGFSITHAQDINKIRIAIGQFVCLDGDRSGNLIRMEHAMQEAVRPKADLITFPETTLLGWVNPDAWDLHRPHLRRPEPGGRRKGQGARYLRRPE